MSGIACCKWQLTYFITSVLLSRLRYFPTQADQYIDSMREGIRRGFVASVPMMHKVEAHLMEIIAGDIPEMKEALHILAGLNSIYAAKMNEGE